MKRFLLSAVAAMWAMPGAAQTTDIPAMPEACTITSSSQFIRLVHCSQDLSNETYADAGKAACAKQMPCGTWIWRNREDMPEEAPSNHDGLTQAQVTSAVGVWVAEDQSLVLISKQ